VYDFTGAGGGGGVGAQGSWISTVTGRDAAL
jgi:hypothetical protein